MKQFLPRLPLYLCLFLSVISEPGWAVGWLACQVRDADVTGGGPTGVEGSIEFPDHDRASGPRPPNDESSDDNKQGGMPAEGPDHRGSFLVRGITGVTIPNGSL